jgi:exopolysaccharide production protein ExoZ
MTSTFSITPANTWVRGTQGSARYQPIDGIRGLFALLVFLSHFHIQFRSLTHNQGILFFVSSAVWCITRAAVGVFFALSGFLFYGSLLKKPASYFTFVSKRLGRLYPTFLFAFSFYLFFCLAVPSASKLPEPAEARVVYIAANLLMLQGLLHPPMIVQSWTLTFTCVFYLAVPLVVWGFRRLALAPKQRLACLIGLWFVALCSIQISGVMTNGIGFITGMIVAESLPWLKTKASVMGRRAEALAGILVMAACVMLYASFQWHTRSVDAVMPKELFSFYAVACRITVLSLATVVVFMLALEGNGLTQRVLSFGPLATLGTFSYSWYLMHGIALKATEYLTRSALAKWHIESSLLFVPALIVAMLFAWVIAWGTYNLIEARTIGKRRVGQAIQPLSVARRLVQHS